MLRIISNNAPGIFSEKLFPPSPGAHAPDIAVVMPHGYKRFRGCRVAPDGSAMKIIEVSQDELTKYIYQHCPNYFYNWQDGECCQRKVNKETCSLHVFAEDLHCPLDCPRLNTKEYGCDKGRCSKVKAIIKDLKQ